MSGQCRRVIPERFDELKPTTSLFEAHRSEQKGRLRSQESLSKLWSSMKERLYECTNGR